MSLFPRLACHHALRCPGRGTSPLELRAKTHYDKSMRKITFITLAAFVPLACSSPSPMAYQGKYGHGPRTLAVATGSPGELGLLRPLAEGFAGQYDATVLWHKAGSGRSLELLRLQQVDAIMVHAPAAESDAVSAGWAAGRTLIGCNEFYIVGPAADPAGIRAATSAADSYRMIARAGASFLSRGDNSGTHKKEMAIWRAAGVSPDGPWYVETGDFMRATLQRANAEKAYFMTDSSTWIATRKRLPNLRVLFRGDPVLVNVYHALCQPPGATPAADLAAKFVAFLASDKAQQIIRTFGRDEHGEAMYMDAAYATRFASLKASTASPREEDSPSTIHNRGIHRPGVQEHFGGAAFPTRCRSGRTSTRTGRCGSATQAVRIR